MNFTLTRAFAFQAAHILPWHSGKCARLHGHSYRLEVSVAGPLDDNGIVLDFSDLRDLVEDRIITPLDHTMLNDRFANPTVEMVAAWILTTLRDELALISGVRLWETATSFVEVTP
ncbi:MULTISPECIES: 6-carboxytetrahydropterin synthase QueD [Curtobacterium]|uniref:6-carboxytetrahydropterin synthase QueD n=1 Tax=Curtobacterium TaxID=2034 RepID=UPI001BDDD5B9|nr:6-carboxytetrahydropterin synthase QueD [Curtobacterium flaccumfaciens]MBT1679024.1 6-carboxytetrahydropterin synthase QueD [Curtobacterium flaccumfaciens pv. flaccumfaciens]QYI96266.1 6-carboxytetrahydropterin synthase QueD [Curtobacterium flaccumfaciens pv. flaccumfaciens]